MEIKIDFIKNKNLGNVYDSSKTNNYKDFTEAETFYKLNYVKFNDSLINALDLPNIEVNGTLKIPVTSFENIGFMKAFIFYIEALDEKVFSLSLVSIVY